jgi:hypothetical protein
MLGLTYCRAHGSLFAQTEEGDAAALNSFISKPVRFRGAIVVGRGGGEGAIIDAQCAALNLVPKEVRDNPQGHCLNPVTDDVVPVFPFSDQGVMYLCIEYM